MVLAISFYFLWLWLNRLFLRFSFSVSLRHGFVTFSGIPRSGNRFLFRFLFVRLKVATGGVNSRDRAVLKSICVPEGSTPALAAPFFINVANQTEHECRVAGHGLFAGQTRVSTGLPPTRSRAGIHADPADQSWRNAARMIILPARGPLPPSGRRAASEQDLASA
jgi:hypothetical protein